MQIGPEIKECIMNHTSELDIADVSRNTDLGYHTVRRLRLCELEINTAQRAEAVKQLMERALENSLKSKDKISREQDLLRETISHLKNYKNEKSIESIENI